MAGERAAMAAGAVRGRGHGMVIGDKNYKWTAESSGDFTTTPACRLRCFCIGAACLS
ncbi:MULTISPECIES: hypothetical protein [Kocuria]|uniref:Uncharacterized protein n=1 Tax=Kocuria subflava TaxID=1736139 RepID=A0A846TKV5_9MICC|nr:MULTISPECIES: hypothetical protein [Kocuria]NKE09838.1 hypothetical protein [Kocuria subflava]